MTTDHSRPTDADAAYPDYVPCPHCGEPEVEVWSNEKTARCHNCGQTFEVSRESFGYAQDKFHELLRMGRAWFVKFVQFVARPVTLLALTMELAACGQPYTFHGTRLEPPAARADFALTNQDGQTARLSDFRGNLVLLFFGYTHCPDACPATLGQFKQIRSALGADADRVRFVLVTVDPARDTPERLKEYLTQFDPSFIGLTGSDDMLRPVYKEFGISVEETMASESAAPAASHSHDATPSGLFAHTSSVLLFNAEGSLQLIYTDIPWQDIASDLRYLLR